MAAAQGGHVILHVLGFHRLDERGVRFEQVMRVLLKKLNAQALGIIPAAAGEGGVGSQHQEAIAHLGLAAPIVGLRQLLINAHNLLGRGHVHPRAIMRPACANCPICILYNNACEPQ